MDEWGNYPHERRRLFDLIGSTGATGVALLSGNVHYSEVSRTDVGPYPLVDFTSSGLTHVSEVYAGVDNPYRVKGPLADLNFGLVEIDWEAGGGPAITFSAIGLDGVTQFEHQLAFAELGNI
jgi:alkaline phosphatase D